MTVRNVSSAVVLYAPPPGFRACLVCHARFTGPGPKTTVLYEREGGAERAIACVCGNCSYHIERARRRDQPGRR